MFIEIPASNKSLGQRKLIFGIASNNAKYMVSVQGECNTTELCPYYKVWHSMIRRCYSGVFQLKNPTYKGCTVCDDWLLFLNFKVWMIKQDWQGKELDKDLLINGNKEYSPHSCLFVTKEVNSALSFSRVRIDGIPSGVSKKRNRYIVRCQSDGRRVSVGSFVDLEVAVSAYNSAKIDDLTKIADRQDGEVKSAMIRYISCL